MSLFEFRLSSVHNINGSMYLMFIVSLIGRKVN